MSAEKMTDEQLIAFAALHGARGVYQAGFDLAVDRMRGEKDRDRDFIVSIHQALREMGFGPLGLSREEEILHALSAIARSRTADRG